MHISRLSLRLVALLAVVVGAMLAFNSLPPAGDHRASAAGPFILTGVSCGDIYFDLDPRSGKLDPVHPAPPDFLIGESLTRIEPSQTSAGKWDVTSVTYLGVDKKAGADTLTFAQLPMEMQTTINIAIGAGLLPASFRQTVLDLVPDKSSTLTDCKSKETDGTTGPEVAQMDPREKLVAVSNKRPDATGNLYTDNAEHGFKCQNRGLAGPVDDDGDGTIDDGCPAGPPAVGPAINSFQFSTCVFSETVKVWIRTDVQTVITAKGPPTPGQQTHTRATLWFGAGSPTTPNDPLSCSIATALPFPAVIDSVARAPRTDFPAGPEVGVGPKQQCAPGNADDDDGDKFVNDGCPAVGAPETLCNDHVDNDNDGSINDGCAAMGGKNSGIATDPDGPTNPGKFQPQVPDGTTEGPGFVADDWDGDGCPDWDELDKNFVHGRDPFNQTDCGLDEHNFNGVFNILATAFPAAKQGVVGGVKAPIVLITNKDIKGATFDPTNIEDGAGVGSCKDGLDNGGDTAADKGDTDCHDGTGKHDEATVLVPDGSVKRNQKVYWDTADTAQQGWWQVKNVVTKAGATDGAVLNRLYAPPCGLINLGIPGVPAPAPGVLRVVTCNGAVQQGNYFHCISRVNDPKVPPQPAIRPLTSRLVCYIDSPSLSSGSAVPSRVDGAAGAPPPPPYGTGGPADLSGTFDPTTQQIHFIGCFENTGPPTGPNVITDAHIDAKTGKGYADLYFGQSIAACNAQTPAGPRALQIAVTLAEQKDNFDHDRDGCTDADELAKGPAFPKCGDDPYNPYDSDDNISSNAGILVTVARTDVGAPGFYFHCIAHVDQAKTAPAGDQEALTSRVQCYTDSTALTVNPPAIPSPNTGAASCPPAPAAQCGDGQPGPLPPLAFADVDLTHIVLGPGAGNFYDTADNTIHIEGCFTGVDNTIQGPNIYTRVVIAAHNGTLVSNGAPAVAMGAGEGLADIWPAQATCLVPGGAPPINDALIEFAENFSTKGPNPPAETGAACTGNADSDGDTVADDGCPENHYDTDLDGCTDTQELRNTQATGGLRDPYNRWDSMDQYTGSPLAKDRIVAVGDIGAVVSRFGTSGSATGDPLVPPALPTGYHVVADRSGALAGSNSWNLKQPDGVVAVGDIGAVVGQFGHSCTT